MSLNWTRSCGGALLLMLAGLVAFAGCGGSDIPEEEIPPVPMEEAEAGAVFPAILHNQTVRSKGYSWRVQAANISDVELLERSEDANTGNQTAVLWFKTEANGQRVKIKVRVIYKRLSNQSAGGLEVFSYPVSKLTTLEVEPVDG